MKENTNEYPELEGAMNLCNDVINKRANESVQAPDDSETELRRVRSAKNQHVKAQKWDLAALYREIEKLLEAEEPTCSNCQMLLSAIGVGQGLICDLNKCRIPHSQHTCQYHFKTVPKSAMSASFDSQTVTDERIYEESAKKGYVLLATQLAWEDGAKWCRDELKK
jgi:hypothetical protein